MFTDYPKQCQNSQPKALERWSTQAQVILSSSATCPVLQTRAGETSGLEGLALTSVLVFALTLEDKANPKTWKYVGSCMRTFFRMSKIS